MFSTYRLLAKFEFDSTKAGSVWKECILVSDVIDIAKIRFSPLTVTAKCVGTAIRKAFPEVKHMHIHDPYSYYGLKCKQPPRDEASPHENISKQSVVAETGLLLHKERPPSKDVSAQTEAISVLQKTISTQTDEPQNDQLSHIACISDKFPKDRIIRNWSLLSLINGKKELIGKGTFGCILRMQYKKIAVAVKEYDEKVHRSLKSLHERISSEARVLMNISPNESIPILFGVLLDSRPYSLVMQLCTRLNVSLTLHKVIQQCKEKLSSVEWLMIIIKLTQALAHVHTEGFLHNDLKVDNVIIMKNDNREWIPVILDFSEASLLSNVQKKTYKNFHDFIEPDVLSVAASPSVYSDICFLGIIIKKIAEGLEYRNLKKNLITVVLNCTQSPSSPDAHQVTEMLKEIQIRLNLFP